MKIINIKLVFILASILVFILAAQIRLDSLGTHFTQLDDIGVAELLLFPRDLTTTDSTFLKARIKSQSTILAKLVNYCDNNGCFEDILKFGNKLYHFFIVPITQTFAPAQFIITKLLISQDQSYKEIMFWGRLPSFLFSCLSLILVLLFYQKLKHDELFFHQLLAITLLGFSLENIIFSQQMISYAIGVFSVLLLLLMFLFYCELKELTKINMLLLGSFLAMLVYTQYQILFFIPAFISALFFWHLKGRYDIRGKIIKFLPSGFSFLLLFLPLYLFFIRRHSVDAGINAGKYYNAGPSGEFLFLVNPTAGILGNIKYFFQFFFENSIIVLQTMTAFVPEGSNLYLPIFLLILILFTAGIVGFIKADGVTRQIGLFFMLTWITWIILVMMGQLTLSPTRHSLILLPFIVITICQGSYVICDRIQRMTKSLRYMHSITSVVLSVFVITTFIYHIGEFKNARNDRFDESEIENILQQQAVDSIILFGCAYNLILMNSINNKYPIFYGCGDYWKSNAYADNYKISGTRIAFVSMGSEMTQKNFQHLTFISNERVGMNIFNNTFQNHKLIFSKKKPSGSQMEFSNRTNSQSNGFALYVYERVDTN
jgi:hypothetical protein